MNDFFYYLLKVIICSGVLYLYYVVALRNKLFHQWNRFYLLAAVVISLAAPVIQITVSSQDRDQNSQAIQLLQVVQSADEYLEEITIYGGSAVSTNQWLVLGYLSVSVILLCFLVYSISRILLLLRSHKVNRIENIRFIKTSIPESPFSFFNFIFWNESICLHTETGKQIFEHEMVHVNEKHSVDKVFMQVVLAIFWCNPFFWIMRKELKLVHEFIADKKSVAHHGTEAFAAMILQSAFPRQFNSLHNPFFQTSIKRRITMLTKIQNPGLAYVSRLIALPILAATILAFTVRTQTSSPVYNGSDKMTVVIDAGHGMQNGKFTGARNGEHYEDEIVLAISQKIRDLNTNKNIEITLTRNSDEILTLTERVDLTKERKADLFISIHSNAVPIGTEIPGKSGFEITLPTRNLAFENENRILGSALASELSELYKTEQQLIRRKVGIWVLDNSPCPSILIECGNMTHSGDIQFLTDETNQDKIAQSILSGIERYFAEKKNRQEGSTHVAPKTQDGNSKIANPDTVPSKEPVFEKAEVGASIDQKEWRKFLEQNLMAVIKEVEKTANPGTYTTHIRFIVEKDGTLTGYSVVKDPGFGIPKNIIELMKRSPKWKPAVQNGKPVRSYYTQPITIIIANDEGKNDQ